MSGSRRLHAAWVAVLLPFCVHAGPQVAASTTFVGDIVRAIGGDAITLQVIFPRDADPHAYEPTPRDLARLRGVQLLFENGLGLEDALRGPLQAMKASGLAVVDVSSGLVARVAAAHADHAHCAHGPAEIDPHVWYDPVALQTWTTNIEAALVQLDPARAESYRTRADSCRRALAELDAWIRREVGAVPVERRLLVTDHDALGYYADRYGFRLVGAVLPGFSTLAEPSARELVALEKTIRREKAPALFIGGPVPPALARSVATDTGVRLVELPGCALGPAGSETGTLDGYLRTLTTRLVEGLR